MNERQLDYATYRSCYRRALASRGLEPSPILELLDGFAVIYMQLRDLDLWHRFSQDWVECLGRALRVAVYGWVEE